MASTVAQPVPGSPGTPVSPRQQEVLAAISAVRDPEIDETVAALDFIMAVDVEDDAVTVTVRLPTFWCPANFVFLMAQDMRAAVMALGWPASFRMQLVEHFAADEINRGVNDGLPFEEVFPQARSGLDELRRSFDEKAFLMRQGTLVRLLRRTGLEDAYLLGAGIAEVGGLCRQTGGELAEAWQAYLAKRQKIGLGDDESDLVVSDIHGRPVDDLPAHLREIRGVSTNAHANGEMCRMLVAARREGGGCSLVQSGRRAP